MIQKKNKNITHDSAKFVCFLPPQQPERDGGPDLRGLLQGPPLATVSNLTHDSAKLKNINHDSAKLKKYHP